MKRIIPLILLACLTAVCVTWFASLVVRASEDAKCRRGAALARAGRAATATGDILIGVPYNFGGSFPVKRGAALAAKEVNASGGVLGRKIRLIFKDDGGNTQQAARVAQAFADNLDVVAVSGHPYSSIAVPTAIMYEYSGLIFTTIAMNARLTKVGYRRVFRQNITDEVFSKEAVILADRSKYRKIAIYYRNDAYGRGMAGVFQREAELYGVTVTHTASYEPGSDQRVFAKDMNRWAQNQTFDAVFIVCFPREAPGILKAVRAADIQSPLLGSEGMAEDQIVKTAGYAAEGMTVLSIFHPDMPFPETREFVSAFEKAYGQTPQFYDAAAYDTVKLLAHAMAQAKTTVPDKVADALRQVKNWPGATGPHTTKENGDMVKPVVYIKVVDGKFRYQGMSGHGISQKQG